MSSKALFDWLQRNRPDLYQKAYWAPTRNDMRLVMNEATGLNVLGSDEVRTSCVLYLERLKEIAVTPPPGCVDNRVKELQRERTD